MKKVKAITRIVFLSLFLISSTAFATDPDEDPTGSSGTGTSTEEISSDTSPPIEEEEECGFFCSIGEFFEDLFS